MSEHRRDFVKALAGLALAAGVKGPAHAASPDFHTPTPGAASGAGKRKIPVALIQFDTVPEQIDANLASMERLSEQAVGKGARWVMFHEGSLCDYTPRVADLFETVPSGPSVRRMERLARRLGCFISFGMSEVDGDRRYICQVFLGPDGYMHHYRKTWLWLSRDDRRYRNEWARYDPGTGPAVFTIDGVRAACMICADGDAPRCIERLASIEPQVVFYPNNREGLPDSLGYFGARAKAIGAPLLVTNRVGKSWGEPCWGGSAIYGADGKAFAEANREDREEILLHTLEV